MIRAQLPTDDPNALTVLQSVGPRMTKLVRRDGSVESYGNALYYAAAPVYVGTPDALITLLTSLSARPKCCVVPGAIVKGANRAKMRRLQNKCPKTGDEATLFDVPRYVFALDFDGENIAVPDGLLRRDLLASASVVRGVLPEPFHHAFCVAAATSSYLLKPGLRFRLWFRFDRPLTCGEMWRWMRPVNLPIDLSTFHANGISYTAAPVFENPAQDPLPDGRIVVIPGEPTVTAPSAESLKPPEYAPRGPVVASPYYGFSVLEREL